MKESRIGGSSWSCIDMGLVLNILGIIEENNERDKLICLTSFDNISSVKLFWDIWLTIAINFVIHIFCPKLFNSQFTPSWWAMQGTGDSRLLRLFVSLSPPIKVELFLSPRSSPTMRKSGDLGREVLRGRWGLAFRRVIKSDMIIFLSFKISKWYGYCLKY